MGNCIIGGQSGGSTGGSPSILPSGYTQVDYIESSGLQYIDTGYVPTVNTKVVTSICHSYTTISYAALFGAGSYYTTSPVTSTYYGMDYGNQSDIIDFYYCNYYTQYDVIEIPVSTSETININIDKNVVYVNGVEKGRADISTFNQPSATLSICAWHQDSGTYAYPSAQKVYYFKIYDNNVLVRDFIPAVRNYDEKPGLYDIVNNVFYTNAGTGDFLHPAVEIRHVLPDGLRQLDYIESTGTQYINTGNSSYEFKVETKFVRTGSSGILFGFRGALPNYAMVCDGMFAYIYTNSNKQRYAWQTNTEYVVSAILNNRYQLMDINGTSITSYADGVTSGKPNYLFALNQNDTTASNISCKLYYFKLYDSSNALIRNFIPAERTSDKVAGLYDIVNNTFYTNAGTGSFIKGPYTLDININPIGKGTVVDSGSPEGYDRLDYIQSSGTQYINLGVTSNEIDYVTFKVKSENTDVGTIFGAYRPSAGNNYSALTYMTESNGISTIQGNSWYESSYGSGIDIEGSMTYVYDQNILLTLNGTEYQTSLKPYKSANNITLLSSLDFQTTGGHYWEWIGRLYKIALYKNNVLLYDFIPVRRKSDNAIGLYDKVNQGFYGNSGTGTFTAGPVSNYHLLTASTGFKNWVLNGYTQLDYIESSGTQWINTGVNTNSTTNYEITLQCLNVNASAILFGAEQEFKVNANAVFQWGASNNCTVYVGNNKSTDISYNLSTNRHTLIKNGTSFKIDNNEYTISTSSFTSSNPFALFKGYVAVNPGPSTEYNNQRLYSAKLYEGNILVRDFIPVIRWKDSQVGLYDLVEHKFYGNSGTGYFIGGTAV